MFGKCQAATFESIQHAHWLLLIDYIHTAHKFFKDLLGTSVKSDTLATYFYRLEKFKIK